MRPGLDVSKERGGVGIEQAEEQRIGIPRKAPFKTLGHVHLVDIPGTNVRLYFLKGRHVTGPVKVGDKPTAIALELAGRWQWFPATIFKFF